MALFLNKIKSTSSFLIPALNYWRYKAEQTPLTLLQNRELTAILLHEVFTKSCGKTSKLLSYNKSVSHPI